MRTVLALPAGKVAAVASVMVCVVETAALARAVLSVVAVAGPAEHGEPEEVEEGGEEEEGVGDLEAPRPAMVFGSCLSALQIFVPIGE